jgi:ABC-type multidrug transport system fused ATPase/permease subunit
MGYLQAIASERAYAQDFRLFGAGSGLKTRYMRIWQTLFTTRQKATRKRTILICLLDCLPEITAAIVGAHVAFRILIGEGMVGDYALLVGIVAQLLSALSMLSFSVMHIYDNRMQLDNFKSIKSFVNRVVDSGTKQLYEVDSIEFRDVSFTYPATEKRVLCSVSVILHKTEKIALVGLNGSGKSTFVKLLLRFYDPELGEILINGRNIKEYTLQSLRNCFSVYFQDMKNFSFTLQENLYIADEGFPEREREAGVKAALKAAICGDIIEKSNKGLEANITRFFSDDGIELSGGQHQKLALARSLYRRHKALILDEPSSNLDPRAEHELFNNLRNITEGRMTIFTSHRLTNIVLADRIIVLENGCVLEDGTQEQLLRDNKRFAELYGYQKEKFNRNLGVE